MRIVCLADSLISRKNECTYVLFLLFYVYSPLYPCPEITVYRNKGWFSLAWNFFVEQSCQKTLLRNLAIIVPILAWKQTIFDGESILCADKCISFFIYTWSRKKKRKSPYVIISLCITWSTLISYYSDINAFQPHVEYISCRAIRKMYRVPLEYFVDASKRRKLWMRITLRDERSGETSFIRSFDFRQRICRVGCRDKVVVAEEIYWSHPRSWDAWLFARGGKFVGLFVT